MVHRRGSMPLFSRSKPATGDDAEILREALLYLLEQRSKRATSVEAHHLSRIIGRLKKFPTPTGLTKELVKVSSEAGSGDLTRLAKESARTVKALTDALEVAAIMETDLTRNVLHLASSIPALIRQDDAIRIAKEAHHVKAVAAPARRREQQSRKELMRMVTELNGELNKASSTSEQVDKRL
jgi:hypothetical protein